MEKIEHTFIPTNGINMHTAQLGSGPAVLLLHGFPEIWYSWRYQILALAEAGFHAIAPDHRGYGLTENTDPNKNAWSDVVDDIVGLIDALGEDKVFIVAKDWGALVAYCLAYLHPQRVKALVILGVPFSRPAITSLIVPSLPDGHYVKRWAEPGRPEADFGRFDVATVIKKIYILFCNYDMPLASPTQETLDLVDSSSPLPDWFTEEDLKAYAALYEKSGFGHPMEVPYRSWARTAAKLSHVKDFTITAPVLLVIGKRDYISNTPSLKLLLEGMGRDVPTLKTVDIEEGTHFVQEQFPEQVNQLILDFLNLQKALIDPATNWLASNLREAKKSQS